MFRNHVNPLIVGAVSLLGALIATPTLAAGENCVMAIDYSMLNDAQVDRLHKGIDDANDWSAITKTMKCAQSLTYSKLSSSDLEKIRKGISVNLGNSATMALESPNYTSLTEEQVRSYGGY